MKALNILAIAALLASCQTPTASEEPEYEAAAPAKITSGAPYGVFTMATKSSHYEMTIRPDGSATLRSYATTHYGVWYEVGTFEGRPRIHAQLMRVTESGSAHATEIVHARLEYHENFGAWIGNIGDPAVSLQRTMEWNVCQ